MKEEAPREKCLFFVPFRGTRIRIFFCSFLFRLQIVIHFPLLVCFWP